jgi:hypothetical protein
MTKVEAIVQNGGTHGSRVDPLLRVVDATTVPGLPPGKARLRPGNAFDRATRFGEAS